MNSSRLSAIGALAFLAAALLTSGTQSLWYDELFTVWVASRPWGELIHQTSLDGFTPPLFYGLVKLLSLTGLRLEGLRLLSVVFGAVGVFLAIEACVRLFGPRARMVALLLIPSSAYLFTFAHELRPYSALLACAFYFLGHLGGPATARPFPPGRTDHRREDRSLFPSAAQAPSRDVRAAGAALLATAFSYLGIIMVVVWLVECRRRSSKTQLGGVGVAALAICSPGLAKVASLTVSRAFADSTFIWSADPPRLSAVFFGLSPVPSGGWIEGVALSVLAALLFRAHREAAVPALRFLARAFLMFTGLLLAIDGSVRIGFAPRYAALSLSALLVLLVGVLSTLGRAGRPIVVLLFGLNGLAIASYLADRPSPREDWREAMARVDARLGSQGVLLAFPFHHVAVAASAYAPGLALCGGYSSSGGPVFWYEPPARFRGYAFDDLQTLGDPAGAFRRLGRSSDLCLMTDEKDPAKTATVFTAFESLGGAEVLDTGDPRLRVSCRPKDTAPEN